jgi:hypothetical protein
MRSSDELDRFAQAMCKVQAEIQDPGKDKEGYDKRYQYADLGAILKILRPIATKYGISFMQLPTGEDGSGLCTRVMHESGQWVEDTFYIPLQSQKGLSVAQTVGTVITYARRYAITSAFGMAQIDNDAALADIEHEMLRSTADVIVAALEDKDSDAVVSTLRTLSEEQQQRMFNKTPSTGGLLMSKQKSLIRDTEYKYVQAVADLKTKMFEGDEPPLSAYLIEAWRELTETQNVVMWGMMDKHEQELITEAKEAA